MGTGTAPLPPGPWLQVAELYICLCILLNRAAEVSERELAVMQIVAKASRATGVT